MNSSDAAYVFEKAKVAIELLCIMNEEQIDLFETALMQATRKMRAERKAIESAAKEQNNANT